MATPQRTSDILYHLRKDSRKTLAAIAREEDLAVSTVFDHVKKLQESTITRYVPLLQHEKLGRPFRTFFYCDANDDELIDYLHHHPCTNNLYLISGGKIAIDMLFASLQEEEKVREHLEEHADDVHQHKILAPLMIEGWLPKKDETFPGTTASVTDSSGKPISTTTNHDNKGDQT